MLDASYGSAAIADIDDDGKWEIEFHQHEQFSSCPGKY
jgi:hypothetical protein